MEKYQSMLSFFSSFLTVAAVAGFTGVMAEQLTGGKKAGISGKLRYLCALAVVASLAAPLPGFLASLKSALSAPLDLTDRLSAYGNGGDALGGALFSAAAEETLEKNFGDELRSRLSLTEKDLLLFFSVKEEPAPPSSSSENAADNAAGMAVGSTAGSAVDSGNAAGDTARDAAKAENREKAPAGEANTGDRLFSVEQVRAELYTLRAVAKTEEIRRSLAVFSCPVEVRECLLDAHDGEETGEG